MTRPRLRLTLPPLTPREALTLSSICSKIDDMLWTHYAEDLVELLTRDTSVPGTWRSTRRDPGSVQHRPGSERILGPARRTAEASGKEIEQGDVRKRGR
jgi:hypothetical protein